MSKAIKENKVHLSIFDVVIRVEKEYYVRTIKIKLTVFTDPIIIYYYTNNGDNEELIHVVTDNHTTYSLKEVYYAFKGKSNSKNNL